MDYSVTTSLLYLDGVSVSFDGYKALRGLSLTLAPGEMRAIIGPNGAGKTTMMDVITGKTRPDEGDVLFGGTHDLTKLDEAQIAELGIGRKFQKPTVFASPRLTRACASTRFSRPRASRIIATAWLQISRMARSNGWKSACCWRKIPNYCLSMSRWQA